MYLLLRSVPDEFPRQALARWHAAPDFEHIANSASAIYRVRIHGRPHYLRLTLPELRTREQNEAEIAFLEHLKGCGVQVAGAVASTAGRGVEAITVGEEVLFATVFEEAPGERITPDSPLWGPPLFHAWGAALQRIHAAARGFDPAGRWHWRDEDLIVRAPELLADDDRSRREFDTVMARLDERREDDCGLIHADFAPQNFRFDAARGLTAFDFGNCCHHWFAADVANSLSTVRQRPEREEIREALLAGYGTEPEDLETLMRLRVLYVLLSRLKAFAAGPTPEQAAILKTLRAQVHEARGW